MGQYQDAGFFLHAVLRDMNGTYTTLDPPGAVNAFVSGIDDASQIAGSYSGGDERYHGFLATPE